MNGKIPRPTSIPKKNTANSLSSGYSSALRKSPVNNASSENKPTNSRLVREKTAISGATIPVVRRDLLRRSKSFSMMHAPLKTSTVTNFRKPVIAAKRPAPVATSVASVGATAPKQPKVKIAPYDYKARYNDLLERHNALKEKYSTNEGKFKSAEEQAVANADILKLKTFELNTMIKSNCELNEKYADLRNQYEVVNTKHELLVNKNSITESLLKTSELSLTESLQRNAEYKNKLVELENDNTNMKLRIETLEQKLAQTEEAANKFKESLQVSHAHRKILHNTISDLRGNIRVFCRIRPPLPAEESQELCVWNYPDECSLDVVKHTQPKSPLSTCGNSKIAKHEFKFDLVFPPNTSQEEVFCNIESLIQSALDGYNVCIFAYGQTGSGKTFTMEGTDDNLGLIPRSVDFLFEQIASMEPIGWSFFITASFVEIYNEHIRDLLNSADHNVNHEIKLIDGKQNEVYVSNINEQPIRNARDLKNLLRMAQLNRITAQTDSNERSSRSHSVAKIVISSTNVSSGETFKGTLNLVDLAGSESPKTSMRMDETKNINKSLSQLGKVILSLQQKQEHIPYRSSKLTFLLMPCLGGSSKTLMFVNVNPLVTNYSESINSLRFASQVNQVKTLKAKKNKTTLKPK